MMRLLSIDVGIKNLAACLFTLGEKSYEIEAWEVFDLTQTEYIGGAAAMSASASSASSSSTTPFPSSVASSTPRCCFEKKPCKRPVAYQKYSHHYCVMHAKKSDFLMPTAEWKPTKLRSLNKSALAEIIQQHNIELPNSTHNKQMYVDAVIEYAKQKTLEPVVKVKANKLDLLTIGQGLIRAFRHFLGDSKVDAVIIENQISPIASRMKTIQGMIAQYFIMKGVTAIEFVSAANKLKGFTVVSSATGANTVISGASGATPHSMEFGDYDERAAASDSDEEGLPTTSAHSGAGAGAGAGVGAGGHSHHHPAFHSHANKKAYNARKNASVEIVREMLEKNTTISKWNMFFIEHKKKDDLADCFLQGIWYIREKTVEP